MIDGETQQIRGSHFSSRHSESREGRVNKFNYNSQPVTLSQNRF